VDDLLTTKQLQDLLHVDRITIYRMLQDGRLRGFKVGGQWRFSRHEIERWLEGQQSSSEGMSEPSPSETDLVSPVQALPLSCIQAVQSIYAEVLDIAAITIDLDGNPLTDISNSCDFCNLILATPEGRRRCAASWQPVAREQMHTCHAGLLCASIPVEVADQWLASVACCQFVAEMPGESGQAWPDDLSVLAAQLGLAVSDLQAAAHSVRRLPEHALFRVVRLLGQVADTFGEIGRERARFVERLHRIAEMTNL
jgi:excisionase family DNA binding protein